MTRIPTPVRYARARYGEHWFDATLTGLVCDPGGDVRLRRLPAVAPPSGTPMPATVGASGLALDDDCGLYVSDTAGDRILRIGLDCHTTVAVPGPRAPTWPPGSAQPGQLPPRVAHPMGLAVGAHGWLFAATGDGHILVFGTPELSIRDMWSGFVTPVAVACHDGSVLVVDTGTQRVTRYDWHGTPDAAFNAAIAPPSGPADPRAVAVAVGTIFVADAATGSVLRYDWSTGTPAGAAVATGTKPTALAVYADVLYVGDAATGTVGCYALPGGQYLGAVVGFTGPVTALAAGHAGLFIKTGLDGGYLCAAPSSAYAASGGLTIGPLDAGLDTVWARAAVACECPDQTSVRLDWYLDSTPSPATVAWQPGPAQDVLLPGGRYLWLRATVTSRDPASSPVLTQVQARTGGETYLDHLPLVYQQDPDRPGLTEELLKTFDAQAFPPGDLGYLQSMYARTPPEGGFLLRLLELARSQLGDLETAIGDLPAMFDPATAPAASLDWLAGWLAFDLPSRLRAGDHPDEVRQLLLTLLRRYRDRGTPRGVQDAVELHAGVRPLIFEEYRARPLWIVGETPLGFGTGLPDRDLEGILVGQSVVGQTGPADPQTLGAAVFASTAHRFSVIVPPRHGLDDDMRALVTEVVAAERPAHTAFHVCFTEPKLRVGVQARVGVDAIVGAGPDPMVLGEAGVLGTDARLADVPHTSGAVVGVTGRLGIDTRTG
jgi:phage tail-like protein